MATLDREQESGSIDQPASILSKAFDVLGAFDPEHRVLTLTAIARASGLPKSTVHRIVNRLIPLGVIEPHGTGFKVGLPMRRFASAMPIESLRQSALPHLGALHRWSGRHAHLAGLRGSRVIFVERFLVPNQDLPSVDPGTDMPAYATAVGKAMLAFVSPDELDAVLAQPMKRITPATVVDPDELRAELAMIRRRRIAVAQRESHPDVTCVAAPILVRGRAVGAVSLSSHGSATTDRTVTDAVGVVAERISRDNMQVLAQGNEAWFPGID